MHCSPTPDGRGEAGLAHLPGVTVLPPYSSTLRRTAIFTCTFCKPGPLHSNELFFFWEGWGWKRDGWGG